MVTLASLLNTLLRTDLGLKAGLRDFEGKTLKIVCHGWSQAVQIKQERFDIIEDNNNLETDLVINGRPIGFLDYAMSGFNHQPQTFDIQITGDMSFARNFSLWLETYQFDYERLISKLSHEQIGVFVSDSIPKFKKAFSTKSTILQESITQFLQAETKALPSFKQCLDFEEDLIQLRQDVDRLEAKINKLTRQK